MRDDFFKEARSIAARLDLAGSDMQSRRIAEQDFRALGARFMADAVGTACGRAWHRLVALLSRAPSDTVAAEQRQSPV